jgi:nucleotide-binding universal stress UspA family protein
MVDFQKLLLPLDLDEPSMPAAHQAAQLARHFDSQVLILHVVRPLSHFSIHKHELAEAIEHAEERLDGMLVPEFAGVAARRLVLKGDPATAIIETALQENVNAIVVGPHTHSALAGRLLGSVTEKLVASAKCPIWSCANVEKSAPVLPLHNVMCAVDFTGHDRENVRWAAALAAEFQAHLTLAHITPSVEIYGPGGLHEIPDFKQAVVSAATGHIHKVIAETGVNAETYIGSGDVAKMLNVAAQETAADLLVIGRRAPPGLLGGHCYSIISKSHIPVLAV